MITSSLTLRLAARLDEHEEPPLPFDGADLFLWKWAEIEAWRDDLYRRACAVFRVDGDGTLHRIPLQDFYAIPLSPRCRTF